MTITRWYQDELKGCWRDTLLNLKILRWCPSNQGRMLKSVTVRRPHSRCSHYRHAELRLQIVHLCLVPSYILSLVLCTEQAAAAGRPAVASLLQALATLRVSIRPERPPEQVQN